MRFRFVNFVVLPAETLQKGGLAPAICCAYLVRPSRPPQLRVAVAFQRVHTWVMPIDRHSSSQSSFSVPFEESWYSFGMAFSMAFGNCTCRYSNSLSEYLVKEDVVSEKRWEKELTATWW